MTKRIGEFYRERGLLNETQVTEILNYSRSSKIRFGDAALELGYLTREKMIALFGPNWSVDFFNLVPGLVPAATRDLIPREMLIRLGALPLGFKVEHTLLRRRRMLNIGFLDPARDDAAAEIEALVRAKLGAEEIDGIKRYLVLADQFIRVLREDLRVADEELRNLAPGNVDPTLALFLEDLIEETANQK